MQKIVVLLEVDDNMKAEFQKAAGENEVVFVNNGKREFVSKVDDSVMEDADVIIGNPKYSALKKAEHLKWLQTRSSGVDNYMAPGILKPGTMLTSATGAYGVSVAEHVFAMMIGLMKKLPLYRDDQNQSLWKDEGEAKTPEGADILIVGTGDLGSTFAKYCKAFGAHTIGIRQNPNKPAEGIDEMHGMDEIDELIKTADVICAMLPYSEDTEGFFNYERFMSMKKDAIFLNAGRGPVVDSMGLYKALCEGHLFGAGLDTTAPEPLPADHPLWTHPKAMITPHSAGGDHLASTLDKVAAISLENLKRYLAGEEMINRKL